MRAYAQILNTAVEDIILGEKVEVVVDRLLDTEHYDKKVDEAGGASGVRCGATDCTSPPAVYVDGGVFTRAWCEHHSDLCPTELKSKLRPIAERPAAGSAQ